MNKQQECIDVKEGNQYYIRMFARAFYRRAPSCEKGEESISMVYPDFKIELGKDLDGKCKTKIVFSNSINRDVKEELVDLATTTKIKTFSEIRNIASKLGFARIFSVSPEVARSLIDPGYMLNKIKENN